MSCKYFAQSSRFISHRPTALGIEAASFASGFGYVIRERERVLIPSLLPDPVPRSRSQFSEQRYSGKPDGGAGSGAGTPKRKTFLGIEEFRS